MTFQSAVEEATKEVDLNLKQKTRMMLDLFNTQRQQSLSLSQKTKPQKGRKQKKASPFKIPEF